MKGQVAPGQKIVVDKKHAHTHKHKHKHGGDDSRDDGEGLKHAKTVPMTHAEERKLEGEIQAEVEAAAAADGAVGFGSTVNLRAGGPVEDSESVPPGMVHRVTAPARVPSEHSVKSTRSTSTRSFERNKKRDTYPPRTNVDSQKPPEENDYWYQKRSSA